MPVYAGYAAGFLCGMLEVGKCLVNANEVLDKESAALVRSNGTVQWRPQAEFSIPCNTRLRHYPFDSHNCSILLYGWARADELVLQIRPADPSSSAIEGAAWSVARVDHESVDPKDFYSSHLVLVNIFLQRTSRIYRYVSVAPTIITLLTSLFGFWLLPSDTSRYMIGCSNVILMSLCLQNLAATVPAGKDIPLIASYNAAFLCMSGIFLLVTSTTDLLKESSGKPSPVVLRFIRRNLEKYVYVKFLLGQTPGGVQNTSLDGALESPLDGVSFVSPEEEQRKKDWEYISIIVDRIFFYAFVVTYGILLGVLASV